MNPIENKGGRERLVLRVLHLGTESLISLICTDNTDPISASSDGDGMVESVKSVGSSVSSVVLEDELTAQVVLPIFSPIALEEGSPSVECSQEKLRRAAVEEKLVMLVPIKMAVVGIGMIALASGLFGCARENLWRGEKAMPTATIQEVLKAHTPELMSIPGVVGTALGEHKGDLCIKVLVVKQTRELTQKIPSTLEGFPVVIQQTGEIRALDTR